ncbi:MAG: MbnP family protein [Woeseiaceae bacterium]|nr:MbnP family protein [Woeseiaceae bacterium]
MPTGDYRTLRLTLGVPADLNHGDPLHAPAPLTQTPMHWHWRSGYKFLRAGVTRGADGYWLHLGSTRCRARSAISRVARPQIARASISGMRTGAPRRRP